MEVRILLLLVILLFPHAPATTGLAQTTRPEFEVAAIRTLPAGVPNPGARFGCRGVDAAIGPDGVALPTNIPQGRCVGVIALQQMIAIAFRTQRRYVSGGPPWIRESFFQLYHIDAKAADSSKTTADEDLRCRQHALS
jgi:uncharacterized protein (TIGR03435 family)